MPHTELQTDPLKPPTIATVARVANVSIASASRVLNGMTTRAQTTERVLRAAEQVGFVPNAAARSLRSRRTGQIAFAMPDIANPAYTTMVTAIEEVTRERGLRLLLHATGSDAEDELSLLRDLRHRFVDGLILASLRVTDRHLEELGRAAAPVVLIHGRPLRAATDLVRGHSRKGAADAVRHLHAGGRRRIAFLNGPGSTVPGAERHRGYRDGLRSCRLAYDEALVEAGERFGISDGKEAVERLLARGARPDAIFCANDLLAVGALAALHGAGFEVPQDVALVGMDNSPLAEVSWPPLTSVDLGSSKRARIAAELLMERINGSVSQPRIVAVEPLLVVRASSGPVE